MPRKTRGNPYFDSLVGGSRTPAPKLGCTFTFSARAGHTAEATSQIPFHRSHAQISSAAWT